MKNSDLSSSSCILSGPPGKKGTKGDRGDDGPPVSLHALCILIQPCMMCLLALMHNILYGLLFLVASPNGVAFKLLYEILCVGPCKIYFILIQF